MPRRRADAGADETNAAIAEADVHAIRVTGLTGVWVAGTEEWHRLHLKHIAIVIARRHAFIGCIMAHDRPPRIGRISPKRSRRNAVGRIGG